MRNILTHSPSRAEEEEGEGEEGEEGVRYFTIDAVSGVIRTTGLLDREAQPWHNITVMASEVGEYRQRVLAVKQT